MNTPRTLTRTRPRLLLLPGLLGHVQPEAVLDRRAQRRVGARGRQHQPHFEGRQALRWGGCAAVPVASAT